MYDLLGIDIQSPIIIGSGPMTYGAEGIKRLDRNMAGACVTKTLRMDKAINPEPHIAGNTNTGLLNNELWTDYEPEEWFEREFPALKADDAVVIASVGHTLDESSQLVGKAEDAGVAALEIVSYQLDQLIPMVKDAKERVDIPVIAKLPSKIEDIGEFGKKLEEVGADAITACDSVGPTMRVDIETGHFKLGGDGTGWMTGNGILPINLYNIYELRKAVDIPIIGLGGCTRVEDAIEMLMVGANFVGVCTYPILNGPESIKRLNDGINRWLDQRDLRYQDIIGLAHRKAKVERIGPYFTYNEETCIECEKCVRVCAYTARNMDDGMELDEEQCRKCGLCADLCPTDSLKFLVE